MYYLLAQANPSPDSAPPTDYAAWLSAIGTVGALLVALILLSYEVYDRHRNRQADRERVARKISAWCDTVKTPLALWIQNLADEPIYDAVAYIGRMGTNLERLPDPDTVYQEVVFGIIPPGQRIDSNDVERDLVTGGPFPDLPEVAVEFTDSSGLHWRRLANGTLKNVSTRRPFD